MLDDIFTLKDISSREHLVREMRSALGDSLKRIIDTHNTKSIIFIYEHDGSSFLLKAEFGTNTATHREINWYRLVKEWGLKQSVRLLDSSIGDGYALLLLEYIENSATIDEVTSSSRSTHKVISASISGALAIDRKLFDETAISVPAHQVNVFFGEKYKQRRAESEAFPYLSRLLSEDTIRINGKVYTGLDVVMRQIEKSPYLLELLTPKKLGLIHGDLHCGNILLRGTEVFLIDPNGNLMMPIEYDIGKLLHSIHGNYGAIMRKEYTLVEETPSSYRFTLEKVPAYEVALLDLKNSLSQEEYVRSLYAEALHFATMLPHHASAKNETTALFLRSVQLFGELMDVITAKQLENEDTTEELATHTAQASV